MKDYYDIYLIYKFKFDTINKENLEGQLKRLLRKENLMLI